MIIKTDSEIFSQDQTCTQTHREKKRWITLDPCVAVEGDRKGADLAGLGLAEHLPY